MYDIHVDRLSSGLSIYLYIEAATLDKNCQQGMLTSQTSIDMML